MFLSKRVWLCKIYKLFHLFWQNNIQCMPSKHNTNQINLYNQINLNNQLKKYQTSKTTKNCNYLNLNPSPSELWNTDFICNLIAYAYKNNNKIVDKIVEAISKNTTFHFRSKWKQFPKFMQKYVGCTWCFNVASNIPKDVKRIRNWQCWQCFLMCDLDLYVLDVC